MTRAFFCLLALAACRPHGDVEAALYGPRHRPFSSEIALADPRQAYQLLDGFYPIANGARWTAPQFAALLRTAPDDRTLTILAAAPAELLAQAPPVTFACRFDDRALPPLVLEAPRWETHRLPLPPVRGDAAVLDCAVDRARTIGGLSVGVVLARISIER
jgi:hypothetical protein